MGEGENQAAATCFLGTSLKKSHTYNTSAKLLVIAVTSLLSCSRERENTHHLLIRSGKILKEHVWLEILLWLFLENTICHVHLSEIGLHRRDNSSYTYVQLGFFTLHINTVLVQAAKTVLQTGWLISRNLSQFWRVGVHNQGAWLGSGGSPLLGCRQPFSHILSQGRQSKRTFLGLFYKSKNPTHEDSTLMTYHLWKAPPPNSHHIGS